LTWSRVGRVTSVPGSASNRRPRASPAITRICIRSFHPSLPFMVQPAAALRRGGRLVPFIIAERGAVVKPWGLGRRGCPRFRQNFFRRAARILYSFISLCYYKTDLLC